MKFSLFVHMERYDNVPHKQLFEEMLELVQIAEESGFETVWVGEHHAMEFTISPNPFIILSYLAQRTKNIRLGTGTIVAPFWHPIKLAGEAALTDIVSDGRLDLGIARGAYQFEFDRLADGMPGVEGSVHLREIIPAIKGLWNKNYAHEGKSWSFPKSTSCPMPLQTPHPPIWVAARDISSHEFAVENDCNVMITPLWQGDEEVDSLMTKFESALADNPEKPRPQVMLCKHTYIAETDEELEDISKKYSRFFANFGAWFKNERDTHDGMLDPISQEEIDAIPMYAPEVLRRDLLIGTPDEAIKRIRHYESLGINQYSYWIDSGLTHAEKKKSLLKFVEKVVPEFS